MIRNLIPSKICLACLGCCRFSEKGSVWLPHLLKEEGKRLKKIKLVPGAGLSIFLCSYLNQKSNKCIIYKGRPFDCRLYPFLIRRKAKKVFLSADLNCPYMEKHLRASEVKRYIAYLLKFLHSKRFLKILKGNPQIIQEYPGVLDVGEIKTPGH